MSKNITTAAAFFLLAAVFSLRFLYSSPYAATWDQVDFALALERYDLLAMQPHFPGYPFFIFGGMLANSWIENPAQALSVFNGIMTLAASLPVYLLARQYAGRLPSLLVVAALQTNTYLSILSAQPMSEGAAIGALWWYLWAVHRAYHKNNLTAQLLPLLFFSLLMGIRLSYAPFGLAIVLLWIHQYRKGKRFRELAGLAAAAILFQGVWLAALILSEGSISGFLKLSMGFVAGHFTSWGGAVTESGEPLLSRLYRLTVNNVVYTGMFAGSLLLLAAGTAAACLLLIRFRKAAFREYWSNNKLLLTLAGAYFIWNLFAQNIDKPRHSFPIAMLLLFSLFTMAAAKSAKAQYALILFAILQLAVSVPILKEQVEKKPAVYQMAEYLEQQQQPLIVYTWEETRVLQYLSVPYDHKRFYTYPYFKKDISYQKNKEIYLTGELVDGFKEQGVDLYPRLEKVKEFHSNLLFDPVYGEIELYKLKE
ncbi:hypothetical protein ACK1LH_18565 [Metabacillus indicus]|uniref:hypothetical protein n=1 Tax=Metabacillus indicus TaxID=246786 RepID=UPI0039840B71